MNDDTINWHILNYVDSLLSIVDKKFILYVNNKQNLYISKQEILEIKSDWWLTIFSNKENMFIE